MLLEQCTALTLGHPTPDAELHAVVEGVRAALQDDRTVTANHCGLALCGAADEQLVRVGLPAAGLGDPRDPRFGLCAVCGRRGYDGCRSFVHRGPIT